MCGVCWKHAEFVCPVKVDQSHNVCCPGTWYDNPKLRSQRMLSPLSCVFTEEWRSRKIEFFI